MIRDHSFSCTSSNSTTQCARYAGGPGLEIDFFPESETLNDKIPMLSDAEMQLLAGLREAEVHGQSTDRPNLETRGKRFGIYKKDWSDAYSSLIERGLLRGDESSYELTESGRPLAESCHRERPSETWYHYQRFYPIANSSEAHSRFCERVYGMDLCQDGQADIHSVNDILRILQLAAGDRALDLGCGAGGIAEYVSDRTGAHLTGVDSSATAIETALRRTPNKRERLSFLQADMNSLEFPAGSFDAAISIDAISWATDLAKTISSVLTSITSGGQFLILLEVRTKDRPEVLAAEATPVARAVTDLGRTFETTDYTDSVSQFWRLARETAETMREEFVREGTEMICDAWIHYADAIFLPAIEANRIRRYLYRITA